MRREYLALSLTVILGWGVFCPVGFCGDSEGGRVLLEEWRSESLNGMKVGFSYVKIWKKEGESWLRTHSLSEMPGMGVKIRVDSEAEEDGRLRAFAAVSEMAGTKIECNGQVREDLLQVVFSSAGDVRVKEFSLEKPLYESEIVAYLMARSDPKAGEEKLFDTFFSISPSIQPMEITVLGRETESENKDLHGSIKLRTRYMGQTMTSWMTEEGRSLLIVAEVMNMRSVPVSKEEATGGRFDSFDQMELIEKASVPFDGELSAGKFIKSMTVRLMGLPEDFEIPSDGRQRVDLRKGEHATLVIGKPAVEEEADDVGKPDRERWLKADLLVQSDHPDIVRRAKEIVEGAESDREKVRALMDWMNREIRQELRVSLPSAVEILQTRSGDCNEFATLFAALARSVGVPTKICVGIVHWDGRFAYHAWNEVLLTEDETHDWVSVDAIFRQLPADATHIKFAEGELEDHLLIASLLGRLKMKVVEYQARE